MNPVIEAIRSDRGLATKLGNRLGITREAVWMWKQVPPRHALRVARYMKLPLKVVCPEMVAVSGIKKPKAMKKQASA